MRSGTSHAREHAEHALRHCRMSALTACEDSPRALSRVPTLQIIWAPFVDSLRFPGVGLRKSWLVPTQVCGGGGGDGGNRRSCYQLAAS